MALEPTLEELRPREWSVTWSFTKNNGSQWFGDDRLWPDQEAAVAHARALVAMEKATGEIRDVQIHSRMTDLDAGEWVEVVLWQTDGDG